MQATIDVRPICAPKMGLSIVRWKTVGGAPREFPATKKIEESICGLAQPYGRCPNIESVSRFRLQPQSKSLSMRSYLFNVSLR